MKKGLKPEDLREKCKLDSIDCKTTEELQDLREIIGQTRAVKALDFGLNIKNNGFNIFVSGKQGTGRETAVKNFLEELSGEKPVPDDWCYVNNFDNNYEPIAIRLEPGKGIEFKKDMDNLLKKVKDTLPDAFQSEDYASKREETVQKLEEKRKQLLQELQQKAEEEGFVIQKTPVGLFILPVVNGQPMNDKQLMEIDEEKRKEIEEKRDQLKKDLRSTMRQVREIQDKIKEEVEKLNRKVAKYTIGHLIDDLKEKYSEKEDIREYLENVEEDILDNLEQFMPNQQEKAQGVPQKIMDEVRFRKYKVNLLVDNSKKDNAPVVIEHNPTYQNLFGRIEKEAQFGILNTDFTMIRQGSLHKANGGYLVIPVEELLKNMFSWDSVKRALKNGEIEIEEAGERLGFATTKGLRPEAIDLNIKIILIGRPLLYHLLYSLDKDFKELFKVKADFDTTMDRDKDNIEDYSNFMCSLCNKEDLRHLDKKGIARVIEYSSRLASDRKKLSTQFSEVADIIREANFYAGKEESKYITGEHIDKAIEEKIYRSNLIQEKIQEMIDRDFILIDTEGKYTGKVNGLSVFSTGDFLFGRPNRVTASVSLGRKGIIDIERKSKLGGKIHTKGVMILSGYLSERYAREKPLSLSSRIVFEQSYGEIEGDSASSAELYAILSELAGVPIKGGIAVTGSVNQKGEVQAIGGVNEKIEGFFEVCKNSGLTGEQGVIIPESNVQNLMLKDEIIEAVKEGKFNIYSVATIDEGMEILTGEKAGERQEDGNFEEETINHRVDSRLKEMAERLSEYPGSGKAAENN